MQMLESGLKHGIVKKLVQKVANSRWALGRFEIVEQVDQHLVRFGGKETRVG